MADGKITVTLKADKGFDAPWVVLSGDTAGEVRDVLGEVEQSGLLADVGRVAAAFKGYAVAGGTLGAKPVSAPSQNGPARGSSSPSPETNSGWGSPAGQQPQQAPQEAPEKLVPQYQPDGSILVEDRYGNEWEYNVQGNVPQTPRGPAIVKRGVTKSGRFKGKVWRKWMDPSAGPKWREDGLDPVPAGDRWQGEFIKD